MHECATYTGILKLPSSSVRKRDLKLRKQEYFASTYEAQKSTEFRGI